MDWSQVTALTIPEGNVKQVSTNGVVLWKKPRFVEYIESTGTQFINTGIIPNQDDVWVEVDCQKQVNAPADGIVFSIIANTSPRLNINLYMSSQAYFRYGSLNKYTSLINTNRHTYKMAPTGAYIDDTLTFSNTDTSSFVGNTEAICLFGRFANNQYNSMIYPFVGKIYSFKFGQGGTLIQDLRPRLDGNNVACMYDMVTGKYFYNQGTGEFIAGAPTEYAQLEYIQNDSNSLYIKTGVHKEV